MTERYVVVFEGEYDGDDIRYLWRWFTHRGFRHCYVAKQPAAGGWLVLQSVHAGVWLESWDRAECDPKIPPYWPGRSIRMVEIGQFPPADRFLYRGLGNCVSLTKWLLNCRAWWVTTPYQLYRYLLAKGGKEVARVSVSENPEQIRCSKAG